MPEIPALCYATDEASGGVPATQHSTGYPLQLSANSGHTMKKFYRLFLFTIVLATCFISPVATAGQKNVLSHYLLASNQQISEQAAVTIAKKHINGRILAVSRTDGTYRIKILSEKGTVHIVSVNSTDGSVSTAR